MDVYKHMHTPAPPHTTVARQWIITQTSYTRHWNIAELAISSTNVVGKDFARTAPLFCYAILLHFFSSSKPPGWLVPFFVLNSVEMRNDNKWLSNMEREREKYMSVGRRMTNRRSYGFWNNLSIRNQRVLRSSICREAEHWQLSRTEILQFMRKAKYAKHYIYSYKNKTFNVLI